MPRKLALIEIETDEDERLCDMSCPQLVFDDRNEVYCAAFGALERRSADIRRVRAPACLESTRLASLDRAVVEAADGVVRHNYVPTSGPGLSAFEGLAAAVDERRKANG